MTLTASCGLCHAQCEVDESDERQYFIAETGQPVCRACSDKLHPARRYPSIKLDELLEPVNQPNLGGGS